MRLHLIVKDDESRSAWTVSLECVVAISDINPAGTAAGGTALCQLGTIFDIKLLSLVAAHTSTQAGLTDSVVVTEAGVGLWCRREFHANSNSLGHPLCEPHQRIRDDYSGGSALSVAAGEFAFFPNSSPAR